MSSALKHLVRKTGIENISMWSLNKPALTSVYIKVYKTCSDRNRRSGRNTARATLVTGLAVSAFPLYVPV
jgi:hypothetical protein